MNLSAAFLWGVQGVIAGFVYATPFYIDSKYNIIVQIVLLAIIVFDGLMVVFNLANGD